MCKEINVYFIIFNIMNFPNLRLPLINCTYKVNDLWFHWFFLEPSCLLFCYLFYLVLALLFRLVSSQKILTSHYNKLTLEMNYWNICYKSKLCCESKLFLVWLSEPHATSLYWVLFKYYFKQLVRIFQNSHNLQQIHENR